MNNLKTKGINVISLVLITIISVPIVSASIDTEWNYLNYLNSLEFVSCDSPMKAGRSNSITVKVDANIEVLVHFEIKGSFFWGEYCFHHNQELISAGSSEITSDVNTPFKTIIEPTCHFFYYVYVTFPDDTWNPAAWGLVQRVSVELPQEIYLEDVLALLSHVKWTIHTSSLSEGIKTKLITRLNEITDIVIIAFEKGDTQKIVRFLEFLLDLRNRLCEGFYVSDIPFDVIE